MKSHIIPRAFTRRTSKEHFIEPWGADRPLRRQTSWYDSSIVTREGEDFLSKYDNYASHVFNREKLIVRGKSGRRKLVAGELIEIHYDKNLLRLFGLSLLWRSAVSKLHACAEINLQYPIVEEIRSMIVNNNPGSPNNYRMFLSVFNDSCPPVNMAPRLFSLGKTPYARFYLDGVIFYTCTAREDPSFNEPCDIFVGNSSKLLIQVLPFEESWQNDEMRFVISEMGSLWGYPWKRQ